MFELLEQLAGVPVREDSVGGEIVRRIHIVRLRCGRFARTGDSGLGVGDDAAIEIDPSGGEERLERENDGGRVAAGIGDEFRSCEFRRGAVPGFRRRPLPEPARLRARRRLQICRRRGSRTR